MLKINVDGYESRQIHAGDVNTLKKVLERESGKFTEALKVQANADTFRYQQGIVQAIDAVMKLLP